MLACKKPWYSKYCVHYSYALTWEMSVDCRSCTILFLSFQKITCVDILMCQCCASDGTTLCDVSSLSLVLSYPDSASPFFLLVICDIFDKGHRFISCWCIFFRRYITTCFLHPKCVSFLVFYSIVSLVQIGKSTHPLHSLTWVTLIFWADSCELLCNIAFLLLSYQKRKAV